jgi:hypothetical protein
MHIDSSPAAVVESREYRRTRQALIHKFIARKPSTREARAVNTAALLVCRAEAAATDPNASPDMLAKLNAAARHAHRLLVEIAAERKRSNGRSSVNWLEAGGR